MPRWLSPLPVAWHMLTDRPMRLTLSLTAVTFAVVIMFMELGFFNGTNDSSANLPPLFDCDLVVSNESKTHLKTGDEFPEFWLRMAAGIEGVDAVTPMYSGADYWWNPQTGERNRVFMIGVDPLDPMFATEIVTPLSSELQKPDTIIFDRLSRRELGAIQTGTIALLGNGPTEVVGLFDLGSNFTYEGHVITSAASFLRLHGQSSHSIDLGLIRINPDADVTAVRLAIQEKLPSNALLLTPREILDREIRMTTQSSPAGIVFGIGLLVGLGIGIIICYQILFNEVNDNLAQFATLKAMGHQPGFLSGIVIYQALLMSMIGFLPGTILSFGLYALIEHFTQIQMFLTPARILVILGLTTGMCLISGSLAVKKVKGGDPANLF